MTPQPTITVTRTRYPWKTRWDTKRTAEAALLYQTILLQDASQAHIAVVDLTTNNSRVRDDNALCFHINRRQGLILPAETPPASEHINPTLQAVFTPAVTETLTLQPGDLITCTVSACLRSSGTQRLHLTDPNKVRSRITSNLAATGLENITITSQQVTTIRAARLGLAWPAVIVELTATITPTSRLDPPVFCTGKMRAYGCGWPQIIAITPAGDTTPLKPEYESSPLLTSR